MRSIWCGLLLIGEVYLHGHTHDLAEASCEQFLTASINELGAPETPKNTEQTVNTSHLSDIFRKLMISNMPERILEKNHHWGEQREVTIGIYWEKGKILRRPTPMKAQRNEGHWQKLIVTPIHLQDTLQVALTNLKQTPGKTTFDTRVAMDVRLFYYQQLWKSGKRIYSGESRLRCRSHLDMRCELTSEIRRKPDSIFPEFIFRIRVLEARLSYQDLVVEHTLGVGGDAAKYLGKTVIDFVKWVKPDLEKDLLTKANNAIVKAADTKEVHLELKKLFLK